MNSTCPHSYTIDTRLEKNLLTQKIKEGCKDCGIQSQTLWLCLFTDCLQVFCGSSHLDHSTKHNQLFPEHSIVINVTNLRSWCYMCEFEVTSAVSLNFSLLPSHEKHLGDVINAPDVAMATPGSSGESSSDEDDEAENSDDSLKPRGLVGLSNLGLTCYMNAALQAMSNSVPLAQFMTECPASLHLNERKLPGITRSFQRLMDDMWSPKRPSFLSPSALCQGFKQLYPMFRPFMQQDAQEFLRYLMDQLHEELREPVFSALDSAGKNIDGSDGEDDEEVSSVESLSSIEGSQSEADYETCDSGVSDGDGVEGRRRLGSSMDRLHKEKYNCGEEESSDLKCSSVEGLQVTNNECDTLVNQEIIQGLTQPDHLQSSSSGVGSSLPSVNSLSTTSVRVSSPPPPRRTSMAPSVFPSVFPAPSCRRRKPQRYRSIISDVFDGILVSSVQCLTCNTISCRRETFQDLSLPIPSGDQLSYLQQSVGGAAGLSPGGATVTGSNLHLVKSAVDSRSADGWIWWIWNMVWSWWSGPSIAIQHCLSAFFSADELKGDNMYSCEKCGKLRNGIKYSKVLQLPEVLMIHLKRFRHEYLFSSKISQHVTFPLTGLDLTPFLHKDCWSEVLVYDLYAVICHHGTAGGGHYTCYAQNWGSGGHWYEFDDTCVTEVSPETVTRCEAYVLLYKKSCPDIQSRRQRTVELMHMSTREPSLLKFYVSKQWVNRFNTFSEPGPIDNSDFLCPHGGVQPHKATFVSDLVMLLNQGVWEYLHQTFGGGPACTRLYECLTCRAESESLMARQRYEYETVERLYKSFQQQEGEVFALSLRWYRQWEAFALGKEWEIPPPVDNAPICSGLKSGTPTLKSSSDFVQISGSIWHFFHDIYGGGPELLRRCNVPANSPPKKPERVEGGKKVQLRSNVLQTGRSLSSDDIHIRGRLALPASSTTSSGCFIDGRHRTVSACEPREKVKSRFGLNGVGLVCLSQSSDCLVHSDAVDDVTENKDTKDLEDTKDSSDTLDETMHFEPIRRSHRSHSRPPDLGVVGEGTAYKRMRGNDRSISEST